ncbi:MAG: pyruvate flavodoxin/ferredoxin oxidoreductase domain protein [Candidatus Parvarchaeum acidophilus ARMAN-5]|uniref:Pyruvate flavodoxin/ferredoxin oxidoreductase domain protein n=1 Tax=Candidatus Parvarchaeum acidophilus ARMAN-5 TaxID=662762 RepID=D6GVS3_PARA5|nr:MAG: pyruvate flavodoxin/ferredoxin oxidoreductase domain protein [Candidatus Parvarchaeum acidophilus ARMAN-5]
MVEFTWMTGGKQGSGIDVALGLFSRVMMSFGYNIYGYREYFSNIKGMHSFFTVRVSDKKIASIPSKVDMAIFFDNESVLGEKNERGEAVHDGHIRDIKEGGVLIVDSKLDKNKIGRQDITILDIDFDAIITSVAKKLGKRTSEVVIAKNIICVAASCYLIGLDEAATVEAIREEFAKKPKSVVDLDISVSNETVDYLKKRSETIAKETLNHVKSKGIEPIKKLEDVPSTTQLYMEGFASTAIGKAIAGCKMQIYYPITPASDESVFIESHPELGIRVVQPESELAVLAMTTGAAIAGARASSSTSGPGLSLMSETVTWAGMNEVPIVLVDHQRGAPATGQPTRTEQPDLMFAVHQGHGDFGRIILAPGDIEESIKMTAEAFNYAEVYQLPVIVLGEKAISQGSMNIDKKTITNIKDSYKINRGKLVENVDSGYKRFKFTKDNISERILPGNPNAIFWLTGDEHDEWGHVSEDPNNRIKMMEKRNGKYQQILGDLKQEEKFTLTGNPEEADLLLVTWGGPVTAAREAISGKKVALLQIKLIHPLPSEVNEILKKAKKVAILEENITAQLKQHIASVTGFVIPNEILKYNGRLVRYDEVADAIDRVIKGEKKVVLNGY